MVNNKIDIHKLTLEELSGVIGLYPWYGGARMELCRRMSGLGALSESQIAETALHLGERSILAGLLRSGRAVDCSDRDARRRVYVAGGDFFSQEQYEGARRDADNLFPRFAAQAAGSEPAEGPGADTDGFCTETLARIYLEQGYRQEALDIYSKLSLRYPEKSVYFAALIEEINKKDN